MKKYTITELSKLLRLSYRSVHFLITSNKIEHIEEKPVQSKYFVTQEQLDKYLDKINK